MIGRCPTSTSGLGMVSEYSRRRIPMPPQNNTTFIERVLVPLAMVPEPPRYRDQGIERPCRAARPGARLLP